MIVIAGESLADLVATGRERFEVHTGGGPFNTARGVARLGQPAAFLGCVSDDALGQRLRAALADDGVSLRSVVDTRLPTMLALVELDAAGSAKYHFYTHGTAAPSLRPDAAVAALPPEFDVLYLGSLGLVLEPIAEALVELAAQARSRDALVVCDPNIRASLIDDRDPYMARLRNVLRCCDVLKASAEDLAWLVPGATPEEAGARLLGRGPTAALITLGANGALVLSAGARREVPGPQVQVVDTIGAGDAFSAGFLAFWRQRGLGRAELTDIDALAEAAGFACLIAGRAVEQAGAVPDAWSRPDADWRGSDRAR